MSELRDMILNKSNEGEKLDSISILLTNLVEFFSTFAEDLSDKVDLLELKIDKLDEKVSNIKIPQISVSQSTLSLPPPPPLTKPVVVEKQRPESLRGKIMDELKEQLERMRQRQKADDDEE